MFSPIDDLFQPLIQIIFIIFILYFIINIKKYNNDKKNIKEYLFYMILGAGIYHYFILPIIFIHEFKGYEGYDYRTLFQNENEEPKYKNILFRSDKYSPLEAIHLLINKIKTYENKNTEEILSDSLQLNDKNRIKILSQKINEV
tara:strand:- start:2329 stop:2760 length:432 start_codon:yes stop_codon:yes gene_type:complete